MKCGILLQSLFEGLRGSECVDDREFLLKKQHAVQLFSFDCFCFSFKDF